MQSFRFHVLCCALIALPAHALSIKDVFDLASKIDAPRYAAQQNKADSALENAQTLTPAPMALTLSGANSLNDKLSPTSGARTYEAELAIPLWQWGQKDRLISQLQQANQLEHSQLMLARWELAGAVREATWVARLAQFEQLAAEQKVAVLQSIADDVARQLKAGEVAPLDLNLAQQAVLQAQLQLAQNTQAARESLQHFHALIGQPVALPDQNEIAPSQSSASPTDAVHPLQQLEQAQAALAQAQLAQAQFDTREAPELALTLTRERGDVGEEYKNQGKLSIRIPFGSSARTKANISSANLELMSAQTKAQRSVQQLNAQQSAAQQALVLAQRSIELQTQNLQLASQAWQWQQRSYRAGQTGLNAYLNAQRDYLDRGFALQRAELEWARANSRYLQTMGVLP